MKKQLRIKLTKSLLTMIAIVSLLPIVQPVFALPEPTVSTDATTDITTTTATLNGTVSDAGDSPVTSRGFNYGLTGSYGDTANEVVPDSYSYVTQWGKNLTSNGQFQGPADIAEDSSGNIFVVDTVNARVQKFNSSGVYQSQFGSYGTGDGRFYNPSNIAIDSSGNMYVSDLYSRVQKFNSSGVFQSNLGTVGSGDGQFSSPNGIAIDSSDNIFVADTNNNRIQKFNSSGVFQSKFGSAGSGNGQFSSPRAIAIDSSGSIFVADSSNRRIQKFNSSGVFQSKFGSAGSGDGQFNTPRGIAIDSSDNIFVADTNNNRIQKFNSSGVFQSKFGSAGSGDGQFSSPRGIMLDSSSNIYVSDYTNNRIQKFDSSGAYSMQWGYNSSNNGEFLNPWGLTADSSGNVYVTDNTSDRIQKFDGNGAFQLKFGSTGSGDGQFRFPKNIAVDTSGNMYVADSTNYRIQKFNSSGVFQSKFGSFGTGDGQFASVWSVAIDSLSNIWVVDNGNNRIQKFNSSGVYQSQFGLLGSGDGQFNGPKDIGIDSANNIYVVDSGNNRIQKFNSSGVYQSQFGSSGTGNGQFGDPGGIAIDATDNVYVADTNRNRIQKFNSSGVYQSKFGSAGTSNGQFTNPQDIAIDPSGDFYVTDKGNLRVQKFTKNMNVSSFTANITGLTCGTTYHYQAYASNSDGSTEADDATFMTASCDPGPPTDLSATSNSSTTIYVTWSAPASTGNTPLSNYKIYYQKLGDSNWQEIDTQSTTTSRTITGLETTTQYDIKINAQNSAGYWSGDSAITTAITQESPNPYPPQNLSAIASSSSTLDLSWDEPTYTGSSGISWYKIIYRPVGDINWSEIETYSNSTSFNLTGLESDTEYQIKIQARNSNLYSVDSAQVSATTDIYVSPSPDSPTNLQATINSSISIDLSWDAPSNTGDSPITYYSVFYQLVGDDSWNVSYTNDDETTKTLIALQSSSQYNIKVVANNQNSYYSVDSEIITATTGSPGFYLITNCQQLQNIQDDLTGNYELANNIDCSETVNWNGGAGFAPIGDILQQTYFTGILAGNNYRISDIYINQTGGEYAIVAPFGAASGALFQDIQLVRPDISGSSSGASYVAGLVSYIYDISRGTDIANVHITDAQLSAVIDESGSGQEGVASGGLVAGVAPSEFGLSVGRSNFIGSIHVSSGQSKDVFAGGLYGIGEFVAVENSYAAAAIVIDSSAEGYGYGVGGLAAYGADNSFTHSYSAGSIAIDDTTQASGGFLGGIAGVAQNFSSFANSFSRVSLSNSTPAIEQRLGGLSSSITPDKHTSTNNYFDADQAGNTDCIAPGAGTITNCTPISGQPNYFYNNTTNAPLNTWDFDNIWKTTSTLPVFGEKVLTSITAIPESRLNPDPVTPPAVGVPSIAELTKKLKPSSAVTSQFAGRETISTPKEEAGILGAIKRFFKNLPEAVLVSFPYVLFSLLLLAAGAMLIQVVIGSRRLAATKLLIAKQKAVAEERDTFWHLAANYLRAPITLMIGGVELLSTDKDIRLPAVAQLEVFAKNLQKKVFAIMSRIEQSRTLQDIHWPELESSGRVLTQLKFWLPVGLVAFFAVSMNLVARNYRNLSLSTTNLAIQLLIFILVSVLFYWVLSALGLVNRKRKQAEALLEQQSATLDDARTEFIEQSAATLDKDLTDFEAQLDSIPKKAASVGIIHEGAHRLRTLIDSFELLVAAQNNKLDNLSPAAAHTQLNTIFDGVLSSLQPIISQKQLKVVTPNLNNVTLPGNALLLNQVIGSVVSNAVAFSPTGSTIQLDLKQHKDGTRLSVTNQGETIDEDQLSHVFSPLTKADGYDALQLDHGGLGVNLYIDRLIMQHLGGGISVASDAHKGTTLTMLWPKSVG